MHIFVDVMIREYNARCRAIKIIITIIIIIITSRPGIIVLSYQYHHQKTHKENSITKMLEAPTARLYSFRRTTSSKPNVTPSTTQRMSVYAIKFDSELIIAMQPLKPAMSHCLLCVQCMDPYIG